MRSVFLPALFFLGACSVSADSQPPGNPDGLKVEFRATDAASERADAFSAGDTITFVFELTNTSSSPGQFSYTFPPHRVSVFPEGSDEPAWTAFEGRMFPQVMRNETLAAGESKRFTVEWNPSSAGHYRAEPDFNAFSAGEKLKLELELEPVTITVE